MREDLGKKIKELRLSKQLTLKDLSNATGLSIGFLSQLERGLTTVALDSLSEIASVMDVGLSYFINEKKSKDEIVLRSYEKEVFQINHNRFVHYNLTNNLSDKVMLPRFIEILPMETIEDISPYVHKGEEFIYVLEGVLTLIVGDKRTDLFPGDSAHYSSKLSHNWANFTTKTVRLLSVNTPNRFFKEE